MKRGRNSNASIASHATFGRSHVQLDTYFIPPDEYEGLVWGLERVLEVQKDKYERVSARGALVILRCGERLCKQGRPYQLVLLERERELLASLAIGIGLQVCSKRLAKD